MTAKINFLRGKRGCTESRKRIEVRDPVCCAESFCGPKSYYANQDMFCNLKPDIASSRKKTAQKIYTKEL